MTDESIPEVFIAPEPLTGGEPEVWGPLAPVPFAPDWIGARFAWGMRARADGSLIATRLTSKFERNLKRRQVLKATRQFRGRLVLKAISVTLDIENERRAQYEACLSG